MKKNQCPDAEADSLTENYKFINHRECEFFPCHETPDEDGFNCLFCYCPLYALGEKCGGDYVYLDSGIKDCSRCLRPHRRDSYDYVMSRMGEVIDMTAAEGHHSR